MRLNRTAKILMENGKAKEIKVKEYQYNKNGITLNLILHKSEQIWNPDKLDISEVSSGLRLTTTNKTLATSTMEDVDLAIGKFLEKYGIEKINKEISERKLS